MTKGQELYRPSSLARGPYYVRSYRRSFTGRTA